VLDWVGIVAGSDESQQPDLLASHQTDRPQPQKSVRTATRPARNARRAGPAIMNKSKSGVKH